MLSEQMGGDLIATSAGFIECSSPRLGLTWKCAGGSLSSAQSMAQSVPLESLVSMCSQSADA